MSAVRYSPKYLVAIAGRTVYMGNSPGNLTACTNGTDVIADTLFVDMTPGPGSPVDPIASSQYHWHMYIVDGSSYLKLDVHTGDVLDWEAFNGADPFANQTIRGVMPFSANITLEIIDHSSGQPIVSGNRTGDYPATAEVVIQNYASGTDGSYTVSSVSYDSGNDETTITLTVNPGIDTPGLAATTATISDVSGRATLCALYRDRLVLAGFVTEPTTWYMSAIGDPLNWDFGPEIPAVTAAVAGPLTDAGRTGDRITALIPFSDDLMLFGCEFSTWMLRGDPGAGGQIDSLSRSIGVVGQDAWCFDNDGNLYIFSFQGLYRIAFNGAPPVKVGMGRLDKTFSDLNLDNLRVLLEYDRDRQMVVIFFIDDDADLSEFDEGAGEYPEPVSYAYDVRTDSFWPIRVPADVNPSALTFYEHPNAAIRSLMLGSRDGYLRGFADDVYTDESGPSDPEDAESTSTSSIESYVVFGPYAPFGENVRWTTSDTAMILGGDSKPCKLRVYSSPTAEQVIDEDTPRSVFTVDPTRSRYFRQRVAGQSTVFELYQLDDTGTWSFEHGTFVGMSAGRERRPRR